MKYTRLFFYSLLTASLLLSCKGEDGEPGPQGEPGIAGEKGDVGENGEDGVGFEKRGFLEGTISGTRKDGVAFSEAFKYEYGFGVEGFYYDEDLNKNLFSVYRNLNPSQDDFTSMEFDLEVVNKGTANESLASLNTNIFENRSIYVGLIKELNPTTIFSLQARGETYEKQFTHIVNPTLNSTYKFALGEDGYYDISFVYDNTTGESTRIFKTTDGKKVYFEDENENYDAVGDYGYGNLIKVENSNGTLASNTPYNQLRWTQDNNIYFFRSTGGTDLSSTITIPADTYTITNYVKNATTGIITFDFSMTIGALGRDNTSRNPLTITGKYNSGGRVYSDVVSRKRN